MPPQPIHIVLDHRGRRIDISPVIKHLHKIERDGDWTHPETETELAELAGKLISATCLTSSPAALIDRLVHHVSRRFRDHLAASWRRVSEACD